MSNLTVPLTLPLTQSLRDAVNLALYGSFSPMQLFGASDQGVWFDHDDNMDTKLQWCIDNPGYTNASFLAQFPDHALFQDSAGTTAVTAVEQVLGMVKDKSGKGNHRTQATTGSKPKWSARKNLLTYTEDFSNAVWGKVGTTPPVVTANVALAPDGTMTADQLYFAVSNSSGRIQQVPTAPNPVGQHVIQISLKGAVGGEQIQIWNGWSSLSQTVTLTTEWQRFSFSVDGSSNSSSGIYLYAISATPTVYAWGAQMVLGTTDTATTYQRVTTTTDYNAIGFPKGCKYDGIDDGMATASIDFTATDSISISTGVQKTSDSAQGMLLEHTASLAANNGSFYISAPNSAASNYAFASKGTVSATDIETGFASPHTAVLTGIADISGDSALLRINGVAGTAVTTDQGTGNFANAALYFGRRGGASLPFTGVEYQTTIINRPLTASELANIETFNATKSGVTLP